MCSWEEFFVSISSSLDSLQGIIVTNNEEKVGGVYSFGWQCDQQAESFDGIQTLCQIEHLKSKCLLFLLIPIKP